MSSIGAAIGYGYTSLAAYKYAKKEKNKEIIVTGVIGSILALVFMVLLLVSIPMFNCYLGKESYICLILWILIGVVFYFTAKKKYN